MAVRLFLKLFGTPDLHTHIRLRPMLAFFRKFVAGYESSVTEVLEPGCGGGVNAFEMAKIAGRAGTKIHYTGIDTNAQDIENAKGLSARLNKISDIEFYRKDAVDGLKSMNGPKADIVLLIDIIEHVADTRGLIPEAHKRLKEGGIFAVSVPTRLYPKIFGRNFHKRIGHIRDGYSLEELDSIFVGDLGCRRLLHVYNTGLVANIGCWLFYNVLDSTNKWLTFLKAIILYPFIWLDLYNSPRVSCTLFAVYKKELHG